jgi:hypothetical protein
MGFYDGASDRIPEMLVGLDVTRPRGAARKSAAVGGAGQATVVEAWRAIDSAPAPGRETVGSRG